MRKAIIILAVIAVSIPGQVFGSVDGITAKNWEEYEKPIKDAYGFNKGECNRPYLDGEEYFYSEYYDHWNVDKIYTPEAVAMEKRRIVQEIIGRWK